MITRKAMLIDITLCIGCNNCQVRRVRTSGNGLFAGAVMVILGFVMHRLNVSITGMEWSVGGTYFPSWMEVSVTAAIVTFGFLAFSLAAKYLPVYEEVARATEREPLPEPWIDELTLVSERS